MKRTLYHIACFLFSFFVVCQTALGQNDVDSLLQYADKQIYDNPDLAIKAALEVYNTADVSAEIKVEALLKVSRAYTSLRAYEKSLEYSLIAEKYSSQISEKQKIDILNKIGNQYQQLKIYDKAIEYLDESLAIALTLSKNDSISNILGYNYATRGFIYREQMSCDIALTYFDKAIDEFSNQKTTAALQGNISIMLYNKGNCLLNLNQNNAAKNSFLSAIDYAEKDSANSLVAFAQKGLAEVTTLEGKYKEAIEILDKAVKNSEDVGDLVLNQGLYAALSNNYLALNDFNKYKVYREKYILIQEQIKTTERKTINQSISKLVVQHENKTNQLNSYFNKIKWTLYFLIFCLLGLLISTTILKEKKLKKLEKSLKN